MAADEIIPRAIDDVPDAPRGRVTLEPPDPDVPPVLADGPLLERAIANLVGNAVQHTDSPVTITVSALRDKVEIRVIDRGPGIPAAYRDQVFLPFQRLGDRDNSVGVGLGLALSRGLVEAMNGTLLPEDTPGGGLTMVLALPAADQEDVTVTDVTDTDPGTTPHTTDSANATNTPATSVASNPPDAESRHVVDDEGLFT